jgi:hypothetical protein
MTAAPATAPDISPEFVSALAERAQQAEERRRLPESTVDDFIASARRGKAGGSAHRARVAGPDRPAAGGDWSQRPLPGHSAAALKRDVAVPAGRVVFDYDTGRELAAALILGVDVRGPQWCEERGHHGRRPS